MEGLPDDYGGFFSATWSVGIQGGYTLGAKGILSTSLDMTPFAIGGDIFDWLEVDEIQPSINLSAEIPRVTLINVGAHQEGLLP